MSDIQERTIGELTVQIDRLLCVGFGDCLEVSPDAFELDEEGIAVLRDGVTEVDPTELMDACRSCPVDALTVFDAEGTQVVP